MGPLVLEILSHQSELTERARGATDGANEASLLVGQVVCRALGRFDAKARGAEISLAMRKDLDALIEKALRAQH
jgi:hypothetical protein